MRAWVWGLSKTPDRRLRLETALRIRKALGRRLRIKAEGFVRSRPMPKGSEIVRLLGTGVS